jgi:glycosyltransferase involved in cell wall biosynthesis
MRVVLVVYGSIDQVTGGYLYDRKVLASLQERGDRVEILSLSRLPYLLSPLQGLNGRLRRRLKDFAAMGTDQGNNYDQNLAQGQGWLVVDELVHPSLFLALLFRRESLHRMATLVHHLRADERIGLLRRTAAELMERVLLNRSGMIIVNSAVTEGSVRRRLKRDIPIHVCKPGRDTLQVSSNPDAGRGRKDAGKDWGPVQLLSVGNIIPRKGHLDLLEMLIGLGGTDWRLVIVGRDEPRSRYSRRLHGLVDRAGLSDRVLFAGTVSDSELQNHYLSADVFVFPSSCEGYGIALAEALCSALPYVAFDSGGVREIAGCGGERAGGGEALRCRGGFIVDRDSTDVFSRVLGSLIRDRNLRERLSEESAARALALPTWEQTGACFHDALHGTAFR